MGSKIFTSRSGWFSFTLPADWDEYDDEEEDTYAFFNSNSWTGNLRISPFRWMLVANSDDDKAGEFIADEFSGNIGASSIKIN